ncbi:MAG: TraB/GumN family protein [Deltaproteobacteria bacterium]|nr:TraB/GumN family protein [Candidatus Anaeroferrophillus wilburensis]MBN2887945.1 TraB/GumN family protein [Deltaproteobacteria bacterium]
MSNSTTIDTRPLPSRVHRLEVNGKTIYLVGTAHVSKESVQDVHDTVSAVKPEAICIELCESRRQAITRRDAWQQMDIIKVVREKKSLFLLAQLILTSFYRKIGEQLGVQPGAEMIAGMELAKQTGAILVLADRNIEITLKRVWGYLNLWNRMKMIGHLLFSLLATEEIGSDLIEEMKEQDQLEHVLEELSNSFPEVKKRLIDERDIYLAQKIREAPGQVVVAVVGAGHVPGIKKYITTEHSLEPLMTMPPTSPLLPLIKWAIPVTVMAMLIGGFFKSGSEHSLQSIYIWVMVNGVLAGIGAALALGHPLTILSSVVAAPITSLNPMIAAGWVSGLVQAYVKKPTVADLEDLPNAISTVKGFWFNPACRVLLVVVLANLGSSLGTFISGSWIAARLF